MTGDILSVLVPMGFALLLTILIEEAVAIFFFGKQWMGYLLVLLVNVATNPMINFLYLWLRTFLDIMPYSPLMILMEAVVVLVEYLLLSMGLNRRGKRWLALAFLMNVTSYLCGLLLLPVLQKF